MKLWAAPVAGRIEVGDLRIDTAQRQVARGGQIVPLSKREYQLLEYLARNAGVLISRAALWQHVWESRSVPESNVVDVYIRYLRNKLGREPDLIKTVRGAGYVLTADHGAPEP